MVNYKGTNRTYILAEIEDRLRSDGFNAEEAERVVTTLEPKPITIQQASDEFGIPKGTLGRWIHIGHLTPVGRVKFPARGGGKVLVDRAQVEEMVRNPPRNGRPPKTME